MQPRVHVLQKPIWNDDDFPKMSFHDVQIRSWLAVEDDFEFALDLDYLFEWVRPAEGETYFKFWVAPVTLVFENAHEVDIDIRSSQGTIEVFELARSVLGPTPNGAFVERRYAFHCQEGELSVVATGFSMYVRRAPILVGAQHLTLAERGGVSFGRALEPST